MAVNPGQPHETETGCGRRPLFALKEQFESVMYPSSSNENGFTARKNQLKNLSAKKSGKYFTVHQKNVRKIFLKNSDNASSVRSKPPTIQHAQNVLD